jgi:hypothetical protein
MTLCDIVDKVTSMKIVMSRSLPMNAVLPVYGSLSGYNPVFSLKVGLSCKLQLQRYVLAVLNAVFSELLLNNT